MKKKLKADTILKEYWKEEEHFADLFNALLFQGQQVIEREIWKREIRIFRH